MALLLSAIGIYALVSSHALGLSVREAMVKIGSSGMAASGAGIAAGIVLSFFALRAMGSYIYGVGAYDPVTLLAVPLVLIAVAASLLSTLRVARIDPAETLRSE